jgi:fluoroquinolone transport system permease protein
MSRLMSAMKVDFTVQVRSNLYAIGIGAGVLVAAVMAWLASPQQLPAWIPTLMLLVVGGSTMLYVAAMILFEKEQGTLKATIVSPLRASEYLWSKIVTLTALAVVESLVMVGGGMLLMSFWHRLTLPNVPLLLAGIVAIGVIYTLIGIILIVRYDKITDFLIPVSAVAVILQLPFLYFIGWVQSPLLLVIPTSAPTVLMQGAFGPLQTWEWLYACAYSAALIVGLTVWAYRAFHKHIIIKVG